MGRWTPLLALLLLGCPAEEPRLTVGAEGCWGHADCAEALTSVRSALGAELAVASNAQALSASDCGPVVDCSEADAVVADAVVAIPRPAIPEAGSQDSDPAPAIARPDPEPSTPPVAMPAPDTAPVASEPIAEASSGCGDVSVAELQGASKLSPADVLCLVDVAMGSTSASDPDRQIAAITLYNDKSSGWPSAVEAALKRPALKNAPPLNFAGIKPAYDNGRYGTVVARANNVWRNLDKGYQLSGKDKTFLTEFACRASGQLALQGKDPTNGLDWCERWLSRASKAGQDTGPIEDLIDQLE